METNSLKNSEQELIEQLQKLPLKEVPADLTGRVMARVSPPKPSMIGAVWNYISQSQTISFRPIYAMGVALLILGSFFLGQISQQNPVQVATSNGPESQIEPEILENPESAYMVGRGLLQADNSEAQALAFLQRAALLEPQNPEFAYWEGVGHWANGDKEGERRSYLRGLGADPQSVPLLINLGHNYLSDKNYQEALEAYQAVLTLSPDDPVALYNSGLIYRTLGMTSDEISSWQGYLQRNRQGAKASRAIKRLHGYGDYTFRSYRIGKQTVIVNQQRLLDDYEPAESQNAEFADIVSALDEDQWLNLEIVVFIENDREAAKERALNMKKMISTLSSSDVNRRVGVSWFDVPETIQSADTDQSVILSEGMLLFTHLKTETDRETSI